MNYPRLQTLTTEEAARLVGLSRKTLEAKRLTGEGPRFLKLGRSVRYRREDIDAWLAANLRSSTSEEGCRHG